jgi:hypothetical protein
VEDGNHIFPLYNQSFHMGNFREED